MVPNRVLEGTGEEIAEYAKAHPQERFQLLLIGSLGPARGKRGDVKSRTEAFRQDAEKLHALVPGYTFFANQPEALLDRIEAVSKEIRAERLRKLA